MDYTCAIKSPLGLLTAASDGESLTGLWIEGQKYFCAALDEDAKPDRSLPIFAKTREWIERYFAGERPPADFPLAPKGSAFRQEVWNMLRSIPYGQVATYGEIARRIGSNGAKPTSARAVGGAVGRNPVSIILPGHRVVGSNGSLTGYAGGLESKAALLKLEGDSDGQTRALFIIN